jgi:hypothetical protein
MPCGAKSKKSGEQPTRASGNSGDCRSGLRAFFSDGEQNVAPTQAAVPSAVGRNRPCKTGAKKNGHLRRIANGHLMEAAGIAPASREASVTASTCVAGHLIVSLEAPIGRVPFSLSRHEFNPSRNRRLGSSDPALASPAASRGRKRGARPLLFFRQRDGDHQHSCWQLKFGRLFTRPADQPRHATSHL